MTNTRRTQGEGSAYMRKDGRAAASAMYEGKRITVYGKTKTEAMAKLQKKLDDLKQGKVVIGPKQTVEQYLTHWLEDVHRLEIELTTLEHYRTVLRVHLIPAFGHLQLNQLTRERIQSLYVEKLDAGLSSRRIHNIHAVLSTALKDAVLHEVLSRDPCKYVKLPKKPKHKPHVLTTEECTRLIASAKGCRLWFMLLVALTTGARLGELCALHWEDIDLTSRRIHIHRSCARIKGMGIIEKGPKSVSGVRKVVIAQVVIDAIEEQRLYVASLQDRAGTRWKNLGLIFPSRSGYYRDPADVRTELKAILSDAGIDPRKFHDLRHSAATLLFAAGVNAKVVQETLGHSNISITLGMYGDVMPDMQQGVADIMDKIF